MTTGKFVVFEGVDGAGKTTQTRRVAAALRSAGLTVYETAEPSRGVIGGIVRGRLARENSEPESVFRWAEIEMLLGADRMDHIRAEILPRLEDSEVVLCDRYVPSGYAYGMAGRPDEVNYGEAVRMLSALYHFTPRPDVVLYLDIDPDVAGRRAFSRGGPTSKYDRDIEFLRSVQREYLSRARAAFLAEWEMVEAGAGTPEAITDSIVAILSARGILG